MSKYYVPDVDAQKPLNISGNKQTYFGFETKVVRDILGKHVYSDPMAGFRELYANSVRACKEAEKYHDAQPRIEIRINPSKLDFSIREYDSMGITEDIFQNVLTVLGRSSNFDGELPGQFGIGLAAYYALSDNMFIESHARNGEKIHKLVRNMEIIDDIIETNPVKIRKYGTKMSLKMQKLINKKDEDEDDDYYYRYYEPDKISNWHILKKVIEYLRVLCRFSGVQTDLYIEGRLGEKWDGPTKHELLGPKDPVEYLKKTDSNEIIRVSKKDYDFVGCISGNNFKNVTLAGMPMEKALDTSETVFNLNHMFNGYHINVKNERKYMPTASRDMLKNEAVEALVSMLEKDIMGHVKNTYRVNDINDWIKLSKENRNLLRTFNRLSSGSNDDVRLGGREEMYSKIDKILTICGIRCRVFVNKREVESKEFESILNVYKDEYLKENLVMIKRYRKVKIMATKAEQVVIIPRYEDGYRELLKIIPDVSNVKVNNRVTVYFSGGTASSKIIYESEIKDTYLRVDKRARQIAAELYKEDLDGYSIFRGKTGGITVGDYCQKIMDKKYDGVDGSDILDGNYVLITDNDILDRLNEKMLGGIPVLVNDEEFKELHAAQILLSKKKLNNKEEDDLYRLLGEDIGVNYYGCGKITKVLDCVESIKDADLKYMVATYLASNTRWETADRTLNIITHVKTALRAIDVSASLYEKKLQFRLNMPKHMNEDYFKRLLQEGKTTSDAAVAIGRALGGYGGKYIGTNEGSRNFSFVIDGAATVGNSQTRKLQDLNVIGDMKKFSIIENDGKISTQVWFGSPNGYY